MAEVSEKRAARQSFFGVGAEKTDQPICVQALFGVVGLGWQAHPGQWIFRALTWREAQRLADMLRAGKKHTIHSRCCPRRVFAAADNDVVLIMDLRHPRLIATCFELIEVGDLAEALERAAEAVR